MDQVVVGSNPIIHPFSGRSAARLARLLWEQKVGGSNPLAPIYCENVVVFATWVSIARLSRSDVEIGVLNPLVLIRKLTTILDVGYGLFLSLNHSAMKSATCVRSSIG